MPLHITEPARHLAMITIDNPAKRNAMTRDDLQTLSAAWDRLGADDTCRCEYDCECCFRHLLFLFQVRILVIGLV